MTEQNTTNQQEEQPLNAQEQEMLANAEMQAFFGRVDEMINVANGQLSEDCHMGQVGGSLTYAAARFAAFSASIGFQNSQDYLLEKEKMIEFYSQQFQKMLADNINDYGKNFDTYAKTTKD